MKRLIHDDKSQHCVWSEFKKGTFIAWLLCLVYDCSLVVAIVCLWLFKDTFIFKENYICRNQ